MNVSGDFLCISETSDGIGISCIVAVKEESEMLAGAETLKLVSILSEFKSAILCEFSSIGVSDVYEILLAEVSDVREVSLTGMSEELSGLSDVCDVLSIGEAETSDEDSAFNSRKFSGRIIWSSHSVPKNPPLSVIITIPPIFPSAMPDSFIFKASVMIRHSIISFSVSQLSRRIPLISPSFRVNP